MSEELNKESHKEKMKESQRDHEIKKLERELENFKESSERQMKHNQEVSELDRLIQEETLRLEYKKGKNNEIQKEVYHLPHWWHGNWGPWGGKYPTYCKHGNNWFNCCQTGPPKYCLHGSNWGSCCYNP